MKRGRPRTVYIDEIGERRLMNTDEEELYLDKANWKSMIFAYRCDQEALEYVYM